MARTCKWGVVKVVGGDIWNHSGDVMITPANNRLSGREGLDNQIHQKGWAGVNRYYRANMWT